MLIRIWSTIIVPVVLIIITQLVRAEVSNSIIASKIVFSDSVKTVWEMSMEPGESFPYHTHKNDYLFYVIEGSTLEAFDSDGNVISTIIANTGEVLSFKMDGDKLVSEQVSIPISHGVRNVGNSRYEYLLNVVEYLIFVLHRFREILVEFHNVNYGECSK